jgi:hypothetical protein
VKRRILFVLLSIPCSGCQWVIKEFPEVPYNIDFKHGDTVEVEMPDVIVNGKDAYQRCADAGGNLAKVYIENGILHCLEVDF